MAMMESFLTLNGVMITEDDSVEIIDVKRRFILKRKQWNLHSNAVFEAILRSSLNIESKNLFEYINTGCPKKSVISGKWSLRATGLS